MSNISSITGGGEGSMCTSLSSEGGGGSVYTRLCSLKGVIVCVLT